MPADQPNVETPQHPTSQLTSSELSRYRRELEHAVKALPAHATVRAQLQSRLAEVLEEQQQRTQLAQTINRRGTVGL